MKKLLILIFSIWFLLLALLGDTYLSYYLFVFGAIFQLGLFVLPKKDEYSFGVGFLLFPVYLLILLVLSFYTFSFPRTIYKLTVVGMAFLSFIVFGRLNLEESIKMTLLKMFELIGLALVAIAVGLLICPNLGELLPGFNLIYASYGHSHLAAYLLLILPFSWWNFLSSPKNTVFAFKFISPIVLTIGLLTSFGRVAILLGFIEFFIIFYIHKDQILSRDKKSSKFVKAIVLFIFSLFATTVAFKAYLSLAPVLDSQYKCPFGKMEDQLCKSLNKEPRFKYWRQAARMTKDNLWTGVGAGSYSIAVKKYITDPNYVTAHAHNFYLRKVAELGLVGGSFFFLLIGGLIFLSIKNIYSQQKSMDLEKMLLIGVIAICVDNFFDYDWYYNSLFILTFLFLGIILNQSQFFSKLSKSPRSKKDKLTNRVSILFAQIILIGFFVYTLILSFLYLMTNQMIDRGEIVKAFNTFPYFHWHAHIYSLENSLLNENQTDKLITLYSNESKVLKTLLFNEDDRLKKLELQQQIAYLEPWLTFSLDNIDYYLETSQTDKAEKELGRLEQIINLSRERGFDHPISKDLNQRRMDLARLLYEEGFYERAGELVYRSFKYDTWSIDQQEKSIVDNNPLSLDQISFFLKIEPIPSRYFGSFQEEYADYFVRLALLRAKKQEFLYLGNLTEKAIKLKKNRRYRIKEEFIPVLIRELKAIDSPSESNVLDLIGFIEAYQEYASNDLNSELMNEFEIILLDWAEKSVQTDNFVQTERLMATLTDFSYDKYWAWAQLGNLYVKYDKISSARKAFERCLQSYENQHKDCSIGLKKIEDIDPNYERYDQVRQIILDKKEWTDFEN
ncbi:MAG: O-antigen ligase family protein [Patescibacteria group bacterium]|nr:O-antigen ligase family protein [Patescibacteria group bacterium]